MTTKKPTPHFSTRWAYCTNIWILQIGGLGAVETTRGIVTSDRQTRHLLLLGFGGLLLLLAFTGLTALSVLQKIETGSQMIRQDYFNRDRILEQLRSEI